MQTELKTYTGKEKFLRERFEIRWTTLVKKTKENDHLELPDKEKLWNKLLHRFNNGFECAYCGKKLAIKDSNYPYLQSFSIDHKVSIDIGGNNSIKNLEIVCHRCNIIKGTTTAKSFKKLLETEEPLKEKAELLDNIFKEMWNGRLKNKLNREEART